MRRPTLIAGVDGTLRFPAPEGAPTSPGVTLYGPNGAQVDSGTPSVSGSVLTHVLSASLAKRGSNWRAVWTYDVSGEVFQHATAFDVVTQRLDPLLTEAELRARYPLIRTAQGVSLSAFIGQAWAQVENYLRARGKDPHRFRDPYAFVDAHAAFAAGIAAVNLSPSGEWIDWSEQRMTEGRRSLDSVLANVAWYDSNDDLVPQSPEERRDMGRVVLSR